MPKKKQTEKIENMIPQSGDTEEETAATVESAEIEENEREVELNEFAKKLDLEVLYSGESTSIRFRIRSLDESKMRSYFLTAWSNSSHGWACLL